MGFENSVGVAFGVMHVRHTSWGELHDGQQRCNLFGASLHACSMRKNQRAWVERWALGTVWAWPWGQCRCGTPLGEHFMIDSKGATCLGQGCMHVAKSKGLGGTVAFENSVGVALGAMQVRHTSWGALHDVQQRCNLFICLRLTIWHFHVLSCSICNNSSVHCGLGMFRHGGGDPSPLDPLPWTRSPPPPPPMLRQVPGAGGSEDTLQHLGRGLECNATMAIIWGSLAGMDPRDKSKGPGGMVWFEADIHGPKVRGGWRRRDANSA